jgi:hypothetical protein
MPDKRSDGTQLLARRAMELSQRIGELRPTIGMAGGVYALPRVHGETDIEGPLFEALLTGCRKAERLPPSLGARSFDLAGAISVTLRGPSELPRLAYPIL